MTYDILFILWTMANGEKSFEYNAGYKNNIIWIHILVGT